MSSSGKHGIRVTGLRSKWLLVLLLFAALLVVGAWLKVPVHLQIFLQQAIEGAKHLGAWAPVIFVALYIACCLLLLPAAILTISAGAVFGVIRGSIYVSIGATLGATAAFLVGRYGARHWAARKLAVHPQFDAIDQAVTEEGWRIVFLTRLCPLFPFFLLNYAYGLTRISLAHYVLATWIGIMPGSTLFVYLGSLANNAANNDPAIGWAKTAFILSTAIVATVYLTKVARRSLARRWANPKCPMSNEQ